MNGLDERAQAAGERVRQRAAEIAADAVPIDDQFHSSATSQRRDRHNAARAVLVGLPVVALIAASVWAIRSSAGRSDDLVVGSASLVDVTYERVEYSQTAELTCDERLASTGNDRATFETWADLDGARWRNAVTYPDGSTRDLMAFERAVHPPSVGERGEVGTREIGCSVGGERVVLVAEPGRRSLFSLNPVDELTGEQRTLLTPAYHQLGEPVAGNHTDSTGRPAERWRQLVTGVMTAGHDEGGIIDAAVEQTTDWWVDPDTGVVLERRYTNTIEGLGTATEMLTLVSLESTQVDESVFDTAGYEIQDTTEVFPNPADLLQDWPAEVLAPSPTAPLTSEPDPLPEAPVGITRPGTDPAVCEPYSAREWSTGTFDMTLFAMPEAPLPVQIIGRPGSGPADPFALLIRYYEFQLPVHGVDVVEAGGTAFHIRVFPNGNGEARWALPDGSYGYLRSRGLDQQELESIVVRLSPRDASEPIPGFDVAPPTDDRFDFVVQHEQLNVDVLASGATLECRSPINGFGYRIDALGGDPLSVYGAVIDRPIPLDVGIVNGTLIVISGPEYPAGHPAVHGVVNLDEEIWAELLTQATSTDGMQEATGTSPSDG